jgi:hypothetical protein
MLGTKDRPSLLVNVGQELSPESFDFWVVNGAWKGVFKNGYIAVLDCLGGDFSSLDKVEVLCDNQDRLRGDYQSVFDNFDNPDYVAPKPKRVVVNAWDDDIAF